MANWVADFLTRNPDMASKSIAKRSKHGIHFQDGKQITAVFSGKPCHFQDTDGLWKPIDTKPVLMKNGWFGCPHSDVIIHPDGTVKVGTYEQKASLITAGEGKIDGDRIARPFSGGVQYLYITENGFRQEIVLEKMPDLKQASALLDTVSGTLPTKYKASALSVKDSTTAELADSVVLADAKVLATYLENAKYPVTIDPDFAGGTADGHIYGSSTDMAISRTTSSSYSITSTTLNLGHYEGGPPNPQINNRCYLVFDTSSIGAGSTVTQVNLKLTTQYNGSGNDFDMQIVKQDWSQWEGGPTNATYRETAYDGCLSGTADDNILRNTNGITNNATYTSGNLATAWVSKTGKTYYSMRSSLDYNDALTPGANEYVYFYSANATTESYRPVLTVTYTAGGSKHFLSLLGVGK